MEIISRKEAEERGLDRFFTGVPCRNGHIAERYISSMVCVQCKKENHRKARERNPERYKELKRVEYQRNREYYREFDKKQRDLRRDEINKRRRERYHTDPSFKVARISRSLLHRTLDYISKNKEEGTFEILGYEPKDLQEHLERLWLDGMAWDNYGEWHIDHVYPISRYYANGVDDPAIINGLDNLAPMWAEHNLEKGDLTLEEWFEVKPGMRDVYGHLLKDEA